MGGDEPLTAFPSCRPLAGTVEADEPRRCMLPKKRACGTGLIRAKVRPPFSGTRPLLEPAPRTSFVVRALLREAEPLARCARTG